MNFEFSQEEEAFRGKVRKFIEKEYSPEWRERVRGFMDSYSGTSDKEWEFVRAITWEPGARGCISLAWPEKYGGRGSPILQYILTEELGYSGCPGWDHFGVGMLAPTLINFGTGETIIVDGGLMLT